MANKIRFAKGPEFWPDGFGQLTAKGKRRHYHLGQWLRKRLVPYYFVGMYLLDTGASSYPLFPHNLTHILGPSRHKGGMVPHCKGFSTCFLN